MQALITYKSQKKYLMANASNEQNRTALNFYRHTEQQNEQIYNRTRTQISTVAWVRVFVFISMGGAMYLAIAENAWFWLATLGLLILFIFLMKKHRKLSQEADIAEHLMTHAKQEQQAVTNHDVSFADGGANLLKNRFHPFAVDLDIFGERSLYQLLNRTTLPEGRRQLADLLTNPCL